MLDLIRGPRHANQTNELHQGRGRHALIEHGSPVVSSSVVRNGQLTWEFADDCGTSQCFEHEVIRPKYGLQDIGALLNMRCSETPKAKNPSRIAILEGVTDHTNVGALFRSAAALGVDAVLVTPDCADPLYRRSVRVSMGTVFQVPWTRIPEWPAGMRVLKDAGYVVAGMTLGEGAITLDELVAEDHERLALVFGSEGFGITHRTDALLDRRVTIPMMGGVDSLNVAAASAVTFYATR